MASTLLRESVTIRERRTALGISQQRLAERSKCSLSMIRVLESGYEPKHSEVRRRVIAVLNDSEATGAQSDGFAKTAGGAAGDALSG